MWTLLRLVGLDQYETFLQATDVVCFNDCKGVAGAMQRLAVWKPVNNVLKAPTVPADILMTGKTEAIDDFLRQFAGYVPIS